MQLFIPPLNTKLQLLEDWNFALYKEHRNYYVWEALTGTLYRYDDIESPPPIVTLLKDTIIRIDRIYIRKGQTGYDSVTFTVVDTPNPALKLKKQGGTFEGTRRFWVKLEDANQIQADIV